VREEWNRLNAEEKSNNELLSELRARRDRVQSLGQQPGAREPGGLQTPRSGTARGEDIYDLSTIRASVSNPEEATRELRDRALRAVESAQFPHERANREDVQGHIDRLLSTCDDERGTLARRILTTGSPVYSRAFGKALAGKPLNDSEQRALSLTGSAGGFAVPFTLDPTVIPTSNSAVNPLRSISRVESITTDEWRGVSSAGVTAAYAQEAAQASDNAPTLAQPTVSTERAQAFVPFSIEIEGDWSGLQGEVARMFQDAKDELEADKFFTGSGSDEPFGLLTGATTTVSAGGTAAFATADVYKTEEALPPRFRARAQWVANRFVYNKVRQFDTAGGAALWMYLKDGLANVPVGNTGAQLIGYPANEASAMAAALTTASKIAVLGDFRHFLIVDRIGMNVELIPHLFGANQRPTGQRGVYAIWRNSSKVLVGGAFRTLVTG
jgi:HK97 family phage major capsid protein